MIKSALLCYFRYNRQAVVATEVNLGAYGVCDVLADNGSIYDIEVKISLRDVRRDFDKHKHRILDYNYWNIPNYFYFCVPISILEGTLDIIKNEKIGIICYDRNRCRRYIPERYLYVVRKAGKLNNRYDAKCRDRIIMRLNSEICSVYKKRFK